MSHIDQTRLSEESKVGSRDLWQHEETLAMYFCHRCSKGTMEESAVVVCSIPFCLDCARADPQAILMIAEDQLPRGNVLNTHRS